VGGAPRALRIAATLLGAAAAGLLFQWLHVPLPWMLGPLALTAALGLAGVPVAASDRLRNGGQWAIGLALGLHFTPEVMALVLRLAPALLLGAAWALLLGWGFHRFLRAWSRGDALATPATTYFSAAIGGASEMAVLAERHGGAVDRVAAAHSLRVLIVVASVPLALQAAGVQGADLSMPAAQAVHGPGLALLLLASAAGVGLLRRAGLPNPFVLGALAVTMAFTGSGHTLSALPPGTSSAAQWFIGVSLGARFTPQFMHSAPRWLGGIALGTFGMLVVSALFAWLLARAIGQHPASVVLGNVPGGIAEMAITAAVLHLGVPVVTAFHLVRYVAVLTLTAPLYRRELRRLPLA
jgi:uncharacterized protein